MSYRVSPKEQLLEKLGAYGSRVPEPIRRQWDALSTPKKWAAGVVLPVFAVYFLVFILPTLIPDFSRAPRPAPPTAEELAQREAAKAAIAELSTMDSQALYAEIMKREAAVSKALAERETNPEAFEEAARALEYAEAAYEAKVGQVNPGG